MSSAHRGECVTTGGLYRPNHTWHTSNCTKKSFIQFFFFGVVRLGGGGMVHVSGGRGLHGVSEGGGVI